MLWWPHAIVSTWIGVRHRWNLGTKFLPTERTMCISNPQQRCNDNSIKLETPVYMQSQAFVQRNSHSPDDAVWMYRKILLNLFINGSWNMKILVIFNIYSCYCIDHLDILDIWFGLAGTELQNLTNMVGHLNVLQCLCHC